MRSVRIKSVHAVKDLGVTVASNLKFSQQCKDVVIKANRRVCLIKRKFSFRNKHVVLPLYNGFVRPHLEYTVQLWSPHHAKDIAKLDVQRKSNQDDSFIT